MWVSKPSSSVQGPLHHFIRWSVLIGCNNRLAALASRGRYSGSIDPYSVLSDEVMKRSRVTLLTFNHQKIPDSPQALDIPLHDGRLVSSSIPTGMVNVGIPII